MLLVSHLLLVVVVAGPSLCCPSPQRAAAVTLLYNNRRVPLSPTPHLPPGIAGASVSAFADSVSRPVSVVVARAAARCRLGLAPAPPTPRRPYRRRRRRHRRRARLRIYHYYLPVYFWCLKQLAQHRARHTAAAPGGAPSPALVLGISAPQGCGKTTLVEQLQLLMAHEGVSAASVSIDDFYLSFADQSKLAQAAPDNKLLQYRGNAGEWALGSGSVGTGKQGEDGEEGVKEGGREGVKGGREGGRRPVLREAPRPVAASAQCTAAS